MKKISILTTALFSLLILLSACSDKNESQAKLDESIPVVSMSELIKNNEQYKGKTITISGRFGGMCADGADFYFKDKLDLIEVIPAKEGLPDDVIIGTPLKIQGVVMVRGEHEEDEANEGEEHHEEGGESESEVKIQANIIVTNR